MIRFIFQGGLGNQMFQFATFLSLRNRYPDFTLLGDATTYRLNPVHEGFQIAELFDINGDEFAGLSEFNGIFSSLQAVKSRLLLSLAKGRVLPNYSYIADSNTLDRELWSLQPNLSYIIKGYWASEAYFLEVKDQIQKLFKSSRLLESNSGLQSVERDRASIHIRRGDYLTSNAFVNLADTNYYPNAISFINRQLGISKFYLFSDDPDWCVNNLSWLKEIDYRVISNTGKHGNYLDLMAMSNCKANILANSTFSWWGGWLNNNNDKLVIRPSRVFCDQNRNDKVLPNFYPSTWTNIEAE